MNTKFILVLILIIFILSFLILNKNLDYSEFIEIENINIKFTNSSAAIILENNCYELKFYTTREQAQNIEIALKNIRTERPLTHDLIIHIFEEFNLNIKELRIIKLENGIYYANLVFDNLFWYSNLDLRPSDGVAIALRAKIPIFVKKELAENKCISNIL